MKPTCRILWAGNLLMSDLTFDPSFKVKQWFTGFSELSFLWIQICIGSPMHRSSFILLPQDTELLSHSHKLENCYHNTLCRSHKLASHYQKIVIRSHNNLCKSLPQARMFPKGSKLLPQDSKPLLLDMKSSPRDACFMALSLPF